MSNNEKDQVVSVLFKPFFNILEHLERHDDVKYSEFNRGWQDALKVVLDDTVREMQPILKEWYKQNKDLYDAYLQKNLEIGSVLICTHDYVNKWVDDEYGETYLSMMLRVTLISDDGIITLRDVFNNDLYLRKSDFLIGYHYLLMDNWKSAEIVECKYCGNEATTGDLCDECIALKQAQEFNNEQMEAEAESTEKLTYKSTKAYREIVEHVKVIGKKTYSENSAYKVKSGFYKVSNSKNAREFGWRSIFHFRCQYQVSHM